VSNAELREVSGLSMQGAWRVLRQMTLLGRLRREGSSPKLTRYFPA